MNSILIKGGRVFDGEGFFFSDVFIEDGKISEIAPRVEKNADFIYDADGKTVSFGLVDIHTHIKGISSDAFGVNIDLASVPFGVSAVADAAGAYGDKAFLDSLLVDARVFVEVGIKNNRAVFDGVEQRIEKYGRSAVGLKLYFDEGFGEVFDTAPLVEAVKYAHSRGLSVMVHSSGQPVPMPDLLSVLRCGDILTHTYHGGKNNCTVDNFASLKAARARGVIIDAGLAGHVHTDFKIFGDAIASGAYPDVISTDVTRLSSYKRGGRYGLTMCMSIARYLGMSEELVFRAVTKNAACAIGLGEEYGGLKVGRRANISVLEWADEGFDLTDKAGNHICSQKGYRCDMNIIDGEVVYRR